MRTRLRATGAGVAAVVGLVGCGVTLPAESAVEITAPAAMATHELPLEVRWEAPRVPAGGFAVFVDRAPVAPGQDLRSIARAEDDRACLDRPTCPDASWLRARGIYLVHDRAATIQSFDTVGKQRDGGVHRITVVPLDADDRRPDESGDVAEVVVEEGS